jgi:hypothetical protein
MSRLKLQVILPNNEWSGIAREVTSYQEQVFELKRLATGSGHPRINRPLYLRDRHVL